MPERVKIRFEDDEPAKPILPAKRPKLNNANRNATSRNPKSRHHEYVKSHGTTVSPTILHQPVKSSHRGRSDKPRSPTPSKPYHEPARSGRFREHALKLLEGRMKLPIWPQAELIRSGLRGKKDVLLLVGETGSGKSTQVPQFLASESWCTRRAVKVEGEPDDVQVGGCIAITEPRKVAAISLARRVAEEVGTPLGSSSPASTVGYHVRFDHSISRNTKIKFLTEGMLLQEMLHDPWLRQYSAVIVDEVHERNLNVDLTLGFLRNILTGEQAGRGGIALKVAVMSATADLDALIDFFDAGYGADNLQLHTTSSNPPDGQAKFDQLVQRTDESRSEAHEALVPRSEKVSLVKVKGRQYPVKVIYSPSPDNDVVDAALKLIFKINYGEPLPGDILVFLTGQETVETLVKLVNDFAPGLDKNVSKLLALPLFAALPQASQQLVFQRAPPRVRKVIVATNIAETSVTVPGVRHVIDCGKSKVKQFRAQLGLESLLCMPISQSAATQRKGRAGREAPGTCYRLYTQDAFNGLSKAASPEILRCDIAQAILIMKARGVEAPWEFPLLDAPPLRATARGLQQLCQLETLTREGTINSNGLLIAKLPLSPSLGRTLLAAVEADCVPEVIDIISCLSVEAIFLQPSDDEMRGKAAEMRGELIRRSGDHLTLLAAMQAYASEQTDRKAWCEDRLLSHRAMKGAWDIRKQLRTQARLMNLDPSLVDQAADVPSRSVSTEEHGSAILQCLLKGFLSKTALLCPDGIYRTCEGKHEINIHPASTLYGKKVEAIVYNEFVYTNRSYARTVSSVQAQWIDGEVFTSIEG